MTGIAMVDCCCDYCGSNIRVRKADRERGWGRFCDKACKAKHAANGPAKPKKAPPVIINKKGEPPITDKSKSWLVDEMQGVKRPRPKAEPVPKPENYGEWS